MKTRTRSARCAVDQLTEAHRLLVESAGLLGKGPEDGGIWDAVLIVLAARDEAALARR